MTTYDAWDMDREMGLDGDDSLSLESVVRRIADSLAVDDITDRHTVGLVSAMVVDALRVGLLEDEIEWRPWDDTARPTDKENDPRSREQFRRDLYAELGVKDKVEALTHHTRLQIDGEIAP